MSLTSRILVFLSEKKNKPEDLISLEDQLAQVNKKIQKALDRITLFEDDEEDPTTNRQREQEDEDNPIIRLKKKLSELKQEKRDILRAMEARSQSIDLQDLLEFCDKIDHIKAHFTALLPHELRKLIRSLTKKIEVSVVSMHWIRLSIHWIAPIAIRPDIALIWRNNGTSKKWEEWEAAIVQEHFPTCALVSDLVQLLPNRPYKAMRYIAYEVHHMRREQKIISDFPEGITWEDYQAVDENMAMIEEARKYCAERTTKGSAVWYPFWLDTNPGSILEGECAQNTNEPGKAPLARLWHW